MIGDSRVLLLGKPLRVVLIRVTHSSSETAVSLMSSQVTVGTCLAWKAAQALVEDCSIRETRESVMGCFDWSMVGFARYMDDFEKVSDIFLLQLRESWVVNSLQSSVV